MILSRVRLIANERFDLVDFNAMLSAGRTDSKLWTKQFLSDSSYILKGFAVTGLGSSAATVAMADATLIKGANTSDFSYFTAEPGASNITVSATDLIDNVRNYVELYLQTTTSTPAVRAFWNQTSQSEFNSTINTMTDLEVTYEVRTGGFSGDPDRIPLAIIDVDSGGTIKQIFDERNLFFRLGTGSNPNNVWAWGSQEEPVYTATLTGGSGTYTAGETITFAGTETATVVTGGTTSITFRLPSAKTFSSGDAVVGGDSGANRTLDTVIESFTGADKDIDNFKDMLNALMTEIGVLKGTDYWHQAPVASIPDLFTHINSMLVQNVGTARFEWDGSALTLTDNSGSPADADVIALINKFGSSQSFQLTRQDGTGGSSTISIADGEVLYIELPDTGNRTFTGTGAANTNFQTVASASFVNNKTNFWLGIRSGTKLYIRGIGELNSGDSKEISESDADLKPPFFLSATGTPDLVLNVGPGEVTDPTVGNGQAFAPIKKQHFVFSSGTVTFPATSGNTITVSPGTNNTLTLSSGNFIAVLIQINSIGELSVALGIEAASKAAAISAANFPAHGASDLPIGYVVMENSGGTIQNVTNDNIVQFVGGGGSAGGETAGLEPAWGFEALFSDDLSNGPTTPDNKLNATRTNAAHKAATEMYELSCDKSPTFSSSGTNITLSGSPSFTAAVNDIIWSDTNNTWYRITNVNSQTDFDVDVAPAPALSTDSGMISQAVYTNDIVNLGDATEKHRIRDLFPTAQIQKLNIQYDDSLTVDDGDADFSDEARIVVAASNEGARTDTSTFPTSDEFADIYTRPTEASQFLDYDITGPGNATEERCFAVFFCNPNNASVTAQANLIDIKISLLEIPRDPTATVSSAFAYTDSAGTPLNVTVSTFGGKTRLTLDFSYETAYKSGETTGALEVFLDGKEIPREVSGTTTDARYTEVSTTVIDLDDDYSAFNYSVHVKKRV